MPPEAVLPAEMRYIQRWLRDPDGRYVRAPGDRVLLAAPYWSGPGTDSSSATQQRNRARRADHARGARRVDVPTTPR